MHPLSTNRPVPAVQHQILSDVAIKLKRRIEMSEELQTSDKMKGLTFVARQLRVAFQSKIMFRRMER
jgi:hypothetical protein